MCYLIQVLSSVALYTNSSHEPHPHFPLSVGILHLFPASFFYVKVSDGVRSEISLRL